MINMLNNYVGNQLIIKLTYLLYLIKVDVAKGSPSVRECLEEELHEGRCHGDGLGLLQGREVLPENGGESAHARTSVGVLFGVGGGELVEAARADVEKGVRWDTAGNSDLEEEEICYQIMIQFKSNFDFDHYLQVLDPGPAVPG